MLVRRNQHVYPLEIVRSEDHGNEIKKSNKEIDTGKVQSKMQPFVREAGRIIIAYPPKNTSTSQNKFCLISFK